MKSTQSHSTAALTVAEVAQLLRAHYDTGEAPVFRIEDEKGREWIFVYYKTNALLITVDERGLQIREVAPGELFSTLEKEQMGGN